MMGLLCHDLTLLNFDGTYPLQQKLAERADEWIDLENIPESNLFCAKSAMEEISSRLSSRKSRGITFIGNGNYHYVSYLLLSEIDRPFTLVLFDHHTDAKRSMQRAGMLSCGSWVAEAAATFGNMQHVVIVGAGAESISYPLEWQEKITLLPGAGDLQALLSAIPNEDVYISVDKDVLDRTFAVTNWDQGNMHLKELLVALQTLVRQKNVLGLDVCGELSITPVDVWYHSAELRLNEQTNLAILDSVLSA